MSNPLMNLLQEKMNDPDVINQLASQIGGADTQKTQSAANGILASLLSAASKSGNTQGLLSMLDQDGDGDIMDDLSGFLSGSGGSIASSAIIGSLLGGKKGGLSNVISEMSGLQPNQASQLMDMLGPIFAGAVNKVKNQEGADLSGLANMVQDGAQTAQQGNPAMDMLNQLLDQDGDGKPDSEGIANIGRGLLGSLFGKKK